MLIMRNKNWGLSDKLALSSLFIAIVGTIGTYLALFTPEFRKCVGLEAGDCLLLTLFKPSNQDPPKFNSEELLNTSWAMVPGSYSSNETNGFQGSAHININGISRNKEFVIFDMLGIDADYGRIEGNCKKDWWRTIRSGTYNQVKGTNVRVSFLQRRENWSANPNHYQQTILSFVCNVQEK